MDRSSANSPGTVLKTFLNTYRTLVVLPLLTNILYCTETDLDTFWDKNLGKVKDGGREATATARFVSLNCLLKIKTRPRQPQPGLPREEVNEYEWSVV